MKKFISRWFGSKSDKKEDLFFRKDEEGRDLFYPWGYPGESCLLGYKKNLLVFFFLLYLIVGGAVPCVVIFCFENEILQGIGDFLPIYIMFFLVSLPLIYVVAVFLISRFFLVTETKMEERTNKNVTFFLFFFIAHFVLVCMSIQLIESFPSVVLYMAAFIYGTGCSYVIYRIKVTKGYLFTNKV